MKQNTTAFTSNHLRFNWHSKFSASNFEVGFGHFSPTKIPNFVNCRTETQMPEKVDSFNTKDNLSSLSKSGQRNLELTLGSPATYLKCSLFNFAF